MNRAAYGELHVSVELSGDDVDRLRAAVLRRADASSPELLLREDEIALSALQYVRRAGERASLEFIRARLASLETVVDMLRDKDWTLPGSVQRRILATLSFLADATGLVSDESPMFGYLDEAVLCEILCSDIRHELDGYRDFQHFRDDASRVRAGGEPADGALFERRVAERRKRIRARIQARQYRTAHGSAAVALQRLRSVLRRT